MRPMLRCQYKFRHSAASFSRKRTRFRYTSNPLVKMMGNLIPADRRFCIRSNLVRNFKPRSILVQLRLRFNFASFELVCSTCRVYMCAYGLAVARIRTAAPAKAVGPTGPADGFSALKLRQIGPFRGGRVDAVTGCRDSRWCTTLAEPAGACSRRQTAATRGADHGRQDQLWLDRVDRRGRF